MLFLKYEMLEEPVANVKRLAEFVGCTFSEEEEKGRDGGGAYKVL